MLDQTDTHAFATDHYGNGQGDHLLHALLTHHYRPFEQDADPRPLPEPEAVEAAIVGAMNALTDLLTETRLEDDATDVLWGFVNLFQRRVETLDRKLDDNEVAQKRSQGEQDGSEVRSVELERLIAEGSASPSDATPSSSRGTRQPHSTAFRPARSGARAPARRSTTAP